VPDLAGCLIQSHNCVTLKIRLSKDKNRSSEGDVQLNWFESQTSFQNIQDGKGKGSVAGGS
jgi:hypothetical protein